MLLLHYNLKIYFSFICLLFMVVQQQCVRIWFDHAKAKMAKLSFSLNLNYHKCVFINHQKHQFSVCQKSNGDAKVQTHVYDCGHE